MTSVAVAMETPASKPPVASESAGDVGRIDVIDGLRGVAILMVVIRHTFFDSVARPGWHMVPVYWAVTALASYATYRFIEKPGMLAGRRRARGTALPETTAEGAS